MKIKNGLAELSDGKLYGLNDMVKADTRGCDGCSACCHGVGNTIVLNPFDMYELITGTNRTYEELLNDNNLVDLGHGEGYALTQDQLRKF